MPATPPRLNHLPLPIVDKTRANLTGFGKPSPLTIENKRNRKSHSEYLENRGKEFLNYWDEQLKNRELSQLPPVPREVPIILKCDPKDIDYDYLLSLGFEIISEHDDGVVLVVSHDAVLEKLFKAISRFPEKVRGSGMIAQIHDLVVEEIGNEKLNRVLSEELLEHWPSIVDQTLYVVDVGLSCHGLKRDIGGKEPEKKDDESTQEFEERLDRWNQKLDTRRADFYERMDELILVRETEFTEFVTNYSAEIMGIYSDNGADPYQYSDSVTFRIRISGQGLKDVALNYPFVFDVSLAESVESLISIVNEEEDGIDQLIITAPSESAPSICVIDSGIQEGHRLIAASIDSSASKCFIPGVSSVGDEMKPGGHGTRVTGAIFYPEGVSDKTEVDLFAWIQNARVLNEKGKLVENLFPPKLLSEIVKVYHSENQRETRIFNHSIGSRYPSGTNRMTSWAHAIDELTWSNDIIFIQCAGNIEEVSPSNYNFGYSDHIASGRPYPSYLFQRSCRICNPAQSLQAITVGSICIDDFEDADYISLGRKNELSPFSRTGPGLWNSIKPELVEYGGSRAIEKSGSVTGHSRIVNKDDLTPELIRTSPPGPSFDRDALGTSFSTPKVTHIVGRLAALFPDSSTLLYRALIINSARWPELPNPTSSYNSEQCIRMFGYGLPSLERSIESDDYRVTLIADKKSITAGSVHIYQVPIPESIRSVADEYDISIEVTLSYKAKPRRKRRKKNGYLSTWLSWCSSALGQSVDSFKNKVTWEGDPDIGRRHEGGLDWVVREKVNEGISNISRSAGTIQKDWCTVKSNQLEDGFCIAVLAHKGWDKSASIPAYYSLVVTFEIKEKEVRIYDDIRVGVEQLLEVNEVEQEIMV